MKGLTVVFAMVVALFVSVAVRASQEPEASQASAPTLGEVEKLKVQNLAQRLELAQTQIRVAQLEYERTAQALTALLQSLQKPGYDLNLQTMEYTRKPEKTEPPK